MEWMRLAAAWYAHWQQQTWTDYLVSATAGLAGAGVYAAVMSPKLAMPRYDRRTRTLDLGFCGTLLVGVVAAIVADYCFPVGVLAAVLAPTVIALVSRVVLPGLARAAIDWAKGSTKGNGHDA